MRILFILLLVGFCIVSAKYIPQETNDVDPVLYRVRRSDSDSNAASEERDDNSSNYNDNNEDNDDNDDNDDDSAERKEREKQHKLREKEEKEERKRREKLEKERQKEIEERRKEEEKLAKQQRKEQEKLEKERRKLQEWIEKERRKQEEEERKEAEKIEKEERKRQEKLKKQLKKLQKEQEESAEDRYLETEEEDSVEIEDIWKIHVYDKYGLNVTSTKWERQAALQRYLQEEMGVNANSTKSERRQAILKLIQTKLQNDTATVDSMRNLMLSHVNAAQIQKMRSKLENDIQELNNKSKVLQNITWPGVSIAQQNIEEKRTFLQAIAEFLPNIVPNWFTDSNTNGISTQTNASNDNDLNNAVVGPNNVDGSQNGNGPSTDKVPTGPSSLTVVSQIASVQSTNNQQPDSASATGTISDNNNAGLNGIIGLSSIAINSANSNGVTSIDSAQSSSNPSRVGGSDSLSTKPIVGQTALSGVSTDSVVSGNTLVTGTIPSTSLNQSSGSSVQNNAAGISVTLSNGADDQIKPNVIIPGGAADSSVSESSNTISQTSSQSASSFNSLHSGNPLQTNEATNNILSDNNVVVNESETNVSNTVSASPSSGLANTASTSGSSTSPSGPNASSDNQSNLNVLPKGATIINSESNVASHDIGSSISGQTSGNLPQTSTTSNSNLNIAAPVTASKGTPVNPEPSQPNTVSQSNSLNKNIVVGPSEVTGLPKTVPSVNTEPASVSPTDQNGGSANSVVSDNSVLSITVSSTSGQQSVNTQQTNAAIDSSALNNRVSASSNTGYSPQSAASSTSDLITAAPVSETKQTPTDSLQSNTGVASVNSEPASVSLIDQNGASANAVATDNFVSSVSTSSSSGQSSVNTQKANGASDISAVNIADLQVSSSDITTSALTSAPDSTSTSPSQADVSSQSNSLINNIVGGPSEAPTPPKNDAVLVNSEPASVSQTGQNEVSANTVTSENSVSTSTASFSSVKSSVNAQETNGATNNSVLNIGDSVATSSSVNTSVPASASESTSTKQSQADVSSQSSSVINNIVGGPPQASTPPKSDAAIVNSESTSVSQTDQNGASANAVTSDNSGSTATASSSSVQSSVNTHQTNGASDNSALNIGDSATSSSGVTTSVSAYASKPTFSNPSQSDVSSQSNSVIDNIVGGPSKASTPPKSDAASVNSELASVSQTVQNGASTTVVTSDNSASSVSSTSGIPPPTNETSNTNVVSDNSVSNNNNVESQSNTSLLPNKVSTPNSDSVNTAPGDNGSVKNDNVVRLTDTKMPQTIVVSSSDSVLSSVAATTESQQSSSNPIQSQKPIDNGSLNSNNVVEQSNTILLPKEVDASSNSNPTQKGSNSESGVPSVKPTEPNASGDNGLVKNDIVNGATDSNALPDTVIPSVTTESLIIAASSISPEPSTSSDAPASQTDAQVLLESAVSSVTTESSANALINLSQIQTTVDNSTLINNIDVGQSNTEVLPKKDLTSSNADSTKEPLNGPKNQANETLKPTAPVDNAPVKNDIAVDQSNTLSNKVSVSSNSDLSNASKVEPKQTPIAPSQPSTRGDNGLVENDTLKNSNIVPVPVTVVIPVISESTPSDAILIPVVSAISPSSDSPNDTPANVSVQLLTNLPLPNTTGDIGITIASITVKDVSLPSGTENLSAVSEPLQETTVSNLYNNVNGISSSVPANSSTAASQINTVASNASSNVVTDAIEAVSTGSESFTSSPDVVTDVTSINTQPINVNVSKGNTLSQTSTVTEAATTSSVKESVKVADPPAVSVNPPLITKPDPVIPVKVQVEPGTVVGQENVNTPTDSANVTTETPLTSNEPVLPAGVTVPVEPGASIVGIKTL